MEYLRQENEDFLSYAERLLTNRKEYDLDKVEVYELLYGKQASSDHARKALTTLQMTIDEYKKYNLIKGNKIENKNCTIDLNKDGTQTSSKLLEMSEVQAKDPNYLLEKHGYSNQEFELVSAKNSIWNSGNKILYSSKIIVKPRTKYVWNEGDIKKLFSNLKTEYKNKINISPQNYEENGNTLVVAISDFHYGLFADSYSTGNVYNLDIAEKIYYYTLTDIKNRVKDRKFEKVLFITGNDFINFDNINGTTTAGTPQENASSWFDVVVKATQLIINGIDMFLEIAPVDVQYVISNHDLHTMFGIIQAVKAWYRNDKNVFINDTPLSRKYYKIGKTLLCLTHDMKIKDALAIVTSEAKHLWSESEHIICLLAHLHQAMIYEKQGYLEIYRLPVISGWSRWSNEKGFVQTEKKNQSFIINSELGITDIINTVIGR